MSSMFSWQNPNQTTMHGYGHHHEGSSSSSSSYDIDYNNNYNNNYYYDYDYYSSSPDPPSVDCTLSLGTPSSARDHHLHHKPAAAPPKKKSSSSKGISNFCWDFFQKNNTHNTPSAKPSRTAAHGGAGAGAGGYCSNGGSGGDPMLLARRCANCDTTSTPLWRNGPRGPKSLCNACGIRYKKEERRAAAAAAAAAHHQATVGSDMMMMDASSDYYTAAAGSSPWTHQYYTNTTTQAPPPSMMGNEFGYGDEMDGQDLQLLSSSTWRLNVADNHHQYRHTTLVHDFTR